MRTLPRPLNATVVMHGSDPARLVKASPAPRFPATADPTAHAGTRAPVALNLCTTDCEPCGSNCRQVCQQSCCDRNGRNCTDRTFTRSCCTPTFPDCCNGRCTNFQSSEANCGGCGGACPPGWLCCGGTCINPATDTNNCGDCGRICPTGGVCQGGTCACPAGFPECAGRCCPPGQLCCTGETGGQCTTPGPPRDGLPWCGQSGPSPVFCLNNCPADSECGPICSGELCTVDWYCSPCPPGLIACSGTCTNTATDPNNCSACGNSCAQGQVCCGGICTDLGVDPLNCGSCGNTCPGCCYFGACGTTTTCPDGTAVCCPSAFPTCASVPLLGNRCI
jgi:hypothetical protein